MPIQLETASESEGVIVKELLVSDCGGKTVGFRHEKLAIKIRIFPRKKKPPHSKVRENSSRIDLPHQHLHQHHHSQQQQQGWPARMAKRMRFSCWSAEEDDSQHLHHYDVVADDVAYSSTAATKTSRLAYSSGDACDLPFDSFEDCCWDDADDDGRRRRSHRIVSSFVPSYHLDAAAAAGGENLDEVFEDLSEKGADWWESSGPEREALRPMNAGSATDQRRRRVSQLPPPRHRPRAARAENSAAVVAHGPTERKPPALRRALTDVEAAEVATGYPEVYYVGDAATANSAESARRLAATKKTQDSGGCTTRGEDLRRTYDDEEGYYIHVPHDQIAYRYEVFKVLGRGSFGQVLRAYDHKTHSWVALKIVRSDDRFRRQALDEVRMLSLLSRADTDGQAHVVRMLDHFEFRRHPCIVFEPLGIDLYEALKRRRYRGFPLAAARRAAYGIARCLELLRRQRIIHCDLKPENVLLIVPPPHLRRSSNNINVKVIDFGSSCYETDKLYVYVQSRFYRAPEVILGARYGTAVDMWSLGCIVAELVTGRPLFAGDDEADQLSSQLEYLGMPPARLLARSTRAAQYFSSSTNLPRYCAVARTTGDVTPAGSALPPLTGSTNKSGTYRCPPGSKDFDAALLKTGRDSDGVADRRHQDYVDFVRRCVELDPSERMTPEEALLHPYMQYDPELRARAVAQRRSYRPPPARTARRGRPASHGDENEYS